MRTEKEIKSKIKEIVGDSENFTTDNFGSLEADSGYYEERYSESLSEITLIEFKKWLLGEK